MARRTSSALLRAIRTCVGCRERVAAADLLRVVLRDHEVVVDPTRGLPGRGAALHPDPTCLAMAERRRAFGRALRVTGGQPDIESVRRYVATVSTNHGVESDSASRQEAGRSGMSTR